MQIWKCLHQNRSHLTQNYLYYHLFLLFVSVAAAVATKKIKFSFSGGFRRESLRNTHTHTPSFHFYLICKRLSHFSHPFLSHTQRNSKRPWSHFECEWIRFLSFYLIWGILCITWRIIEQKRQFQHDSFYIFMQFIHIFR